MLSLILSFDKSEHFSLNSIFDLDLLTLTLYQLQLPFNINHMCESYEDPIFHSRFIGKTFFHNYMFDRDLMTVILAYLQPLININNMCKFPEDSTYCSRVIWKTFLLIIACLTLIVTL